VRDKEVASESHPSFEEAKRAVDANEEVVRNVDREELLSCWLLEFDCEVIMATEGCWRGIFDEYAEGGGGAGKPRGREVVVCKVEGIGLEMVVGEGGGCGSC